MRIPHSTQTLYKKKKHVPISCLDLVYNIDKKTSASFFLQIKHKT